jgi:hypothetical protein
MKIYFDMCSLQRPLDDKSQLRVKLEAEAILGMLARWEAGELQLIGSEALVFEADANSDPVRRDHAYRVLDGANEFVTSSDDSLGLAKQYIDAGLKAMDALHLASAVAAKADYFCTCDDRFLKRARTFALSPMKVMSPLELVSEIE